MNELNTDSLSAASANKDRESVSWSSHFYKLLRERKNVHFPFWMSEIGGRVLQCISRQNAVDYILRCSIVITHCPAVQWNCKEQKKREKKRIICTVIWQCASPTDEAIFVYSNGTTLRRSWRRTVRGRWITFIIIIIIRQTQIPTLRRISSCSSRRWTWALFYAIHFTCDDVWWMDRDRRDGLGCCRQQQSATTQQ